MSSLAYLFPCWIIIDGGWGERDVTGWSESINVGQASRNCSYGMAAEEAKELEGVEGIRQGTRQERVCRDLGARC